jgi:hypothetical protein
MIHAIGCPTLYADVACTCGAAPALNRKQYALRFATAVLSKSYNAINDERPRLNETQAQYAERALTFVTESVIDAYNAVMDGALDHIAMDKKETKQ